MAGLSPRPRRRSDRVTPDGTWVDAVGDEEVLDGGRKMPWTVVPTPKSAVSSVFAVRPYRASPESVD